jgi:hypothetical protein
MTPEERIAHNILLTLHEQDRLRSLSQDELVHEVLNDDVSEKLLVIELLNRLCPNWEERGWE